MTKQEAREYFLKKRALSHPADNAGIATWLGEILLKKSIKILHSFVADPAKNEVDTRLIRQILQTKFPRLQWAAPRIIPGTRDMQHFVWDDTTTFILNRWGINEPEPVSSQPLDTQQIDVVLVPLLAYDCPGNRVGYGGGYYDRFLAECRSDVIKIGVSFFEPIDVLSDVNEWDIPLDLCVTPTTVHRWDR